MKNALPIVVSIAILLVISAPAFPAEIKHGVFDTTEENATERIDSKDAYLLHVVGEIEPGDTEVLERLSPISLMQGHLISVRLDISGGDFYEAMKMGRFLREMRAEASVRGPMDPAAPTRCHVAGVLVLAGAPIRTYGTPLADDYMNTLPNIALRAIELPESVGKELDADALGREYGKLMWEIGEYLSEMGVGPELAERMFRVQRGSLDYVPSKSLLLVEKAIYERSGVKILPGSIDRQNPIDNYLPRTEPYILEWAKQFCPDPDTEEEYEASFSLDISSSDRKLLEKRSGAYRSCLANLTLEYQRLALTEHFKRNGVDYRDLYREQRGKLVVHLEKILR